MNSEKTTKSFNKIAWLVLALITIASPFLITNLLLNWRLDANIHDLALLWNDELLYWRQALTFKDAGINGGYYTLHELAAKGEFSRFYAWGMGLPAFYGIIGGIGGWAINAIPVYNLILLTIALGIFVFVTRPSFIGLALMMGVIVFFHPFILYASTSQAMVLDLAFGLFLASGFYPLLTQPTRSRRYIIGLGVVLFLISLVKVTWALFFIPLLFLYPAERSRQTLIARLGVSAILIAILWGFQWLTASYYVNTVTLFINNLTSNPAYGFMALGRSILLNIITFMEGETLEGQLRLVTLGLILYLIIRKRYQKDFSPLNQFSLFSLSIFVILPIFVYSTGYWRDYRMLAPIILITLFLFISQRRYLPVAIVIVMMLPMIPRTLELYDEWIGDHLIAPDFYTQQSDWQEQLSIVTTYDGTQSGWCNTVTYTPYYENSFSLLTAFDSRIGLTIFLHGLAETHPLKSQYLLIDDRTWDEFPDVFEVELLMPIFRGALYRNLNADCE